MPEPRVLCGLALVVLAAGVLKGATGFGGALLMAPAFTWSMGPRRSAVLIVSLHALTSWQGMRKSAKWVRWNAVAGLCAVAIVAAAVVTPWVAYANTTLLRRLAATAVMVFAGLHLSGWRWRSGGGWKPSLSAGILSGALTAAFGLGGPPAAFFFAGLSEEKEFVRGNLMAYFMLLYLSTLLLFYAEGQIQRSLILLALGLTPFFLIGNLWGAKAFARLPVTWFDRMVGLVLMVLGAALLMG